MFSVSRPDCSLEVCGNGLRDPGEQCDDGNNVGGDGCSATCSVEVGLCGNEILDPGEQCDDTNTSDGDGCSHDCKIELSGVTAVTLSGGNVDRDTFAKLVF